MSETRRLCGVPSEREECCRLDSQGYTLRWYAMPFQGMGFATGLGHGIGNGSTLRQNGIEPDKKPFGETFGAATGVSDPRLQMPRIQNHDTGGQAVTVAGYVGPGFHTWPQ